MKLRDQILGKIQQNKSDRAKHQELVESLDRGLIYLQGQLDLVDSMEKAAADAQAAAKKAQDDAAAAAAKQEADAQAGATNVAAAEAPEAQVELSPLPASSSSDEASSAPASN